jgi:hypothetical protein
MLPELAVLLVLAVPVPDVALLLSLPASRAGPDEFVPQAAARISIETVKAAGKRIRMSNSSVLERARSRRRMEGARRNCDLRWGGVRLSHGRARNSAVGTVGPLGRTARDAECRFWHWVVAGVRVQFFAIKAAPT